MLFQRYERAKRARVRQAFANADMGWLTEKAIKGRPVFVGIPNSIQYGYLARVGQMTELVGVNFELMMLPLQSF